MSRLCITGPPRSGKTTYAASLGIPVRHTDDCAAMDWSRASETISRWFDGPAPWVVEGCTVVRALRKWLAGHPVGRPCDRVVFMRGQYGELTAKQRSMGVGLMTIWNEIQPELMRRGVVLELAI